MKVKNIEYLFESGSGRRVWVKYRALRWSVAYSLRVYMEGYGHVAGRIVIEEPTQDKAKGEAYKALLFRGMTS